MIKMQKNNIWDNKIIKKGTRVAVGMSGGVDSSVAAAILLEAGYDVIGITMRIWQCNQEDTRGSACCSIRAVEDARRVAEKLNIPYYVMDFRESFTRNVIDYFTNEYLQGRTPNPCIACNSYIKFGEFLNKARSIGAQYIATGHYAINKFDENRQRYLLLRGEDKQKDQSYALYTMSQEQLAHTIFPLGEYTKQQVRLKAKALELPVADKAESQEICFVPDNDYRRFIVARTPEENIQKGTFLNTRGEVIGQHKGLLNYTVGQRKGLGLTLGFPAYVLALDPNTNAVIVGKKEENYRSSLIASENNYIAIDKLQGRHEIEAQIRYGAFPATAVISPLQDGRVEVRFQKPQQSITPGQSVVYYLNGIVMGGGIIDKVLE